VLAGVAERTTDIDVARAQAAQERAAAALGADTRADSDSQPTHLWAHAALQRAELRLRAAAK